MTRRGRDGLTFCERHGIPTKRSLAREMNPPPKPDKTYAPIPIYLTKAEVHTAIGLLRTEIARCGLEVRHRGHLQEVRRLLVKLEANLRERVHAPAVE